MIAALHITRMLRCTLHFFDVIDTYMLIYNYILQNGILTDDYIRKDYAVLHYSPFLDDTSTAQNLSLIHIYKVFAPKLQYHLFENNAEVF